MSCGLIIDHRQVWLCIYTHVLTMPQPTGLDPAVPLVPALLAEAGYVSHAVGKWHLGYCR